MKTINRIDPRTTTFRQLKSMVAETTDQRMPGIVTLKNAHSPILFQYRDRDEIYTVFENGYFVFQRGQYHTVYAIDRITEIKYSFNDGIQVVTPEEEFADSCCLVALYAIGDLLLTNRENYNHRHWATTLASDSNQFADDSLNPENIMIEREERAKKLDALRKAICSLTPNQQKVISMYYFDGMSQSEIATILGITQQNVSRTLTRSQKALKKYFENN